MTPAQQINHFYANHMERTTISGVIGIFPAAVFLSYFVDDAIDDEHALNNYYLALYIQPFFHSGTSGKKVPLANCKVPLGNLPVSSHRLFGGCVGSHALYT